MYQINETHDPVLKSWVLSANAHRDFPIQNLPFAVFRPAKSDLHWRGGVAIGDKVLDLWALHQSGLVVDNEAALALEAAAQPRLNGLMALPSRYQSALRLCLSKLLREGAWQQSQLTPMLLPQEQVEYRLACDIGDYTDFYTSIYHATAVGKLFRPDNPLLPNYQWVPIGYHGRASSIDVSGQCFPRPYGQLKAPDQEEPVFAPCRRLDYEVEMGLFIGQPTQLGETVPLAQAESHLFGICVFNDWSARDIQAWEYQPLGPFLAKNFASTVSPWIVTTEALAPFRAALQRPDDAPQPLPYLHSEQNQQQGGFDIQLDCFLQTEAMRSNGSTEQQLSRSNFKYSFWTAAQMITHHTSNGCPLQAGDLMGTGTQSGPEQAEAGSLLELTQGGKQAIELDNGEQRTFLQDGDTVIMRAHCQREGFRSIGFGEVASTVLPALSR